MLNKGDTEFVNMTEDLIEMKKGSTDRLNAFDDIASEKQFSLFDGSLGGPPQQYTPDYTELINEITNIDDVKSVLLKLQTKLDYNGQKQSDQLNSIERELAQVN